MGEEERQRRKLAKANRKKGKMKRKQNKTIKKLKRTRYDHQGNVIQDVDEPDVVAVTTYQLSGDTNRNFDALLKTNKKSKKKQKNEQNEVQNPPKAPPQRTQNVPPPNPMISSSPPPNPMNLQPEPSYS